ncbi:hypothetical protein, partial [Ruminococcus bicirculans (ex Wegman et al. 2014)]|uniref:hypothetical protein n=1 Tax=Ruminococcus bicirculans (ex Wegman et al. 2014) TaxID=1160721 RepID=UPI003FD7A88D
FLPLTQEAKIIRPPRTIATLTPRTTKTAQKIFTIINTAPIIFLILRYNYYYDYMLVLPDNQ